MLDWIYFALTIFITVFVHEVGHMIVALLCGIKVKAFSVGFGKILLHKTIKDIDFRLSLIPFGGYTKLSGEYDDCEKGFISQKYYKQVMVLLAGVVFNLILALVCYLIQYQSVKIGLMVDWMVLKTLVTKDYDTLYFLFYNANLNIFLLQLSVMNISCAVFNLIPFPALDGSLLWLVLLKNKVKNFKKFVSTICGIGFTILIIVQLLFVYYQIWGWNWFI